MHLPAPAAGVDITFSGPAPWEETLPSTRDPPPTTDPAQGSLLAFGVVRRAGVTVSIPLVHTDPPSTPVGTTGPLRCCDSCVRAGLPPYPSVS